MIAWWAVRLPGHGWTALAALAVVTVIGAVLAARRLDGLGAAAARGAPVAAAALLLGAIPFIAEGHFGVLGTGFNVDMSQHLFAASWLADPAGPGPGLFEQGYPLGPHALAVATAELGGELTLAFSGVTIAVPAIVGLTALAGLEHWPAWRARGAAVLTAFAYLLATYLAQGAFKELFEIALLLGFVLWLGELGRGGSRTAPSAVAVPGAVIAAGTLYAYSSPGLAWIVATLLAWAALELVRGGGAEARARLRGAAAPVAIGVLALVVLAAPEIDRIVDFGGAVGTVSESSHARGGDEGPPPPGHERDDSAGSGGGSQRLEFDDDLGNLFGQISPLEALGVWPSGDFRVAPGDGAVPAFVFYLGALLGALALAIGVAAAVRAGETALLAALAAALAIWLGARIASTPYTAAKALAVLGGAVMLLSARGALWPWAGAGRSPSEPGWPSPGPGAQPSGPVGASDPAEASDSAGASYSAARPTGPGAQPSDRRQPTSEAARPLFPGALGGAVGVAFFAAAAVSSALALANAPVGPREYEPGARELTARYAGRATLVLVPDEQVTGERAAEFYGWEFREAVPPCVIATTAADPDAPPPSGWTRIAVVGGGSEPPFAGLEPLDSAGGVAVWQVPKPPGDERSSRNAPTCPPAP